MTPSRAVPTEAWTVEDLDDLPDDGYRYEIFDGSLLVSPPAAMPHIASTVWLRDILHDQAPRHFRLIEGAGVFANARNFYIPDLVVVHGEVLKSRERGIRPADVLLAIEVVSPSNPSNDLFIKRKAYAQFNIPEYWIVDRRDESLSVLQLTEQSEYRVAAKVHPGSQWRAEEPFPLVVDPADLFN
ncbi:Endonuclease, Uma2 family (restriction endonuclease fold) [Asanoa hainanensis]|uniref:Endonuclease, Uma2 family (Restriction endonuclease fold) n=1 Tax=Asanoa hainanensis TaxID=560556 RepID=A0A239MS22_9ACTN|nr:Uma2 family endonuclease [Asanoa hainanensis]SNT44942.1 Endonuclease, Uma2 family (restriction endonuclease fold) [Asanoa hainanensis]